MSSENEGEQPQYGGEEPELGGGQTRYGGEQPGYGELGADSAAQFDAFRARQADDREQQETQSSYIFPPEYAADPNALFPPTQPAAVPDGGQQPAGHGGAGSRWRSVAILGAAVLVACALGLAAWAALGSSSPAAASASAGSTATSTAAGTDAGTRTKTALTFRVVIRSVGADSFTGTVPANGETVTVALTDKTRYGTKARPFGQSDLTVGETVVVRGRRTDTDTVTATLVAANVAASAGATDDAGSAA